MSTDVVHPCISGGPVFGFRLNCDIKFTSEIEVEQTIGDCADEHFQNLEATFNEADREYVLGTGIDFEIPFIGQINLDARYFRGLSRLRAGGEKKGYL